MATPSQTLKDRWLDTLLADDDFGGWSKANLRRGAKLAGLSDGEQALAAPRGAVDLMDHFFERASEATLELLATEDLGALRTHERVGAGLKTWLGVLEPHREAVRSAARKGLLPSGAGSATRRVWAIADFIWEAAGDTAQDYNRQTKRLLLSAVIPPTVLYWLREPEETDLDAFIAKRLKQAMRIGQAGGRVVGPILDVLQSRGRRS